MSKWRSDVYENEFWVKDVRLKVLPSLPNLVSMMHFPGKRSACVAERVSFLRRLCV